MYIWLMMTLYFATIVFYTLEKFLTFFAWKNYDERHADDNDDGLKFRKQSYADKHKEHSIAIAARTLGLLFIRMPQTVIETVGNRRKVFLSCV